jgi:hypothetical protein
MPIYYPRLDVHSARGGEDSIYWDESRKRRMPPGVSRSAAVPRGPRFEYSNDPARNGGAGAERLLDLCGQLVQLPRLLAEQADNG